MPVGAVAETVSVTAQAALVETEDSSVGQFIERTTVLNMPLGDRRAGQLVRLSGAVVGSGTNFSIAGGRGNNQMWLLDGTSVLGATLGNQRLAYNPPAESLQEFKLEMNSYSAEYGRSGGGQIVMTTRSGTNQFHGAAYEFLRNEVLDTRTFFAASKAPLRYNVFGASLGGPIARNRTFFFFNYEGSRRREISNSSAVVPHRPEIAGDFSNRTDLRLIDPTTRTQFPGNIIPASRLDPVGAAVARLYPAPNFGARDIRLAPVNNYYVTPGATDNRDVYIGKVDHNLSSKHRTFVRMLYEPNGTISPPAFPSEFTNTRSVRQYNATAGLVYTLTPTLLSETRINYGRTKLLGSRAVGSGKDRELGLTGTNGNLFSTFAPAGLSAIGSTNVTKQVDLTRHLVETVNWHRRRHQLKFGFQYLYGTQPNLQENTTRFAFSDRITGNGFADLLLGRVSAATNRGKWYLQGRIDNYALFIQDDWKATPNLTLNFGLRWELETPRRDVRNQQSGLDLVAINPVCNCRGVVTFAGVDGRRRYASDFDANNFGPRFGFAWKSPYGGLVVRGGYSVHYNSIYHSGVGGWDMSTAFVRQASFSSPDNDLTPAFLLRNGQPAIPEEPRTAGFGSVAPGRAPYYSPSFAQQNHVNGYSQQWNFGLQKQIFGDTVVEAAYLANAGHKLGGDALNINMIPLVDGRGPTVADRRLLPFPQFDQVTHLFPPWANSIYHALSLKAEKRYSNGLNFLVNYTWSKLIDDATSSGELATSPAKGYTHVQLRRLERSIAGNDIRHRMVASGLYALPFGDGRRWKIGNRALRHVVGGWQAGYIVELRTGMPYNVSEQTNRTNTFSAAQRPNLLRDPKLSTDRPRADRLAQWFDVGAFQAPGNGIFGNAPRFLPDGPGLVQIDMSINKTWTLRERCRLLFRSDFFNLPNHPNFGNPNGSRGAGPFGRITNILSGSTGRQIQMNLRFEF
jgi:hypothetical protein